MMTVTKRVQYIEEARGSDITEHRLRESICLLSEVWKKHEGVKETSN